MPSFSFIEGDLAKRHLLIGVLDGKWHALCYEKIIKAKHRGVYKPKMTKQLVAKILRRRRMMKPGQMLRFLTRQMTQSAHASTTFREHPSHFPTSSLNYGRHQFY